MSKYNLIDIFEQYQIGSGFTRDFDYAGMLNAGLKTGVDTDIEILRKMSDDFEDVNYHRENNHLQKAIDALEEGAIKEASMFFGDFHAEIKSTMETFDMSDDLGTFMVSKMEEGEAVDLAIEASQKKAGIEVDESFKSLAKKVDKQKGVDKDYAGKIAGKIANIKRKGGGSGPTAKQKKRMAEDETNESFGSLAKKIDKQKGKSKKDAANIAGYIANIKRKGGGSGPTAKQKKRMNEVRIDRDVADKIEGMLSRPLKAQFLDAFDDLWEDLTEDDMFYPEDVINHLNNEMHKRLSLYRTPDPKPEEIPMFKGTRDALDDISIREESKGVDFIRALKVDANGTKLEIKSYLESLKRSGDKFDSIDDYVEDFKNYVADKALQEEDKVKDKKPRDGVSSAAAKLGIKPSHVKEIDYKLDPYEDRDEIIKQVMSLLIKEKGASREELKGFIEMHIEDILNARDDDAVVDEFTQYLSVNEGDRALKEHFGRFMKDYQ